MADSPLKVWLDNNGTLLRLRLANPPANIIDSEMISAINQALETHANDDGLLGVLLDHEGDNFSFGASVPEHLPENCAEMIAGINGLVKRMLSFPLPILVAVNGQCLGGGLEVACAGSLIFAHPEAQLGQPEIKVGVFAPAASVLLPTRIGQIEAEDLLYSGRTVSGDEAYDLGLANFSSDAPEAAALDYFDNYFASLSSAVLRYAVQAARNDLAEKLAKRLDQLEPLYLDGLMATRDAVEGLNAFIDKRPAKWEHR